jgi:2-polyprenyl-6-hydroxyphenyl methylase/3-demethylubiquinone-9 3-methyltransferase
VTAIHEAEVGARFDLLHRRFKDAVAGDDVRLQAVRAALEPLAGKRVLDLGCGKGRFAAHLRSAGAEVFGIDLSAAMLAGASYLPRVRGSARRLPFAASAFDAVVAIEVFEHLAEVDSVLGEMRRVVRPGGAVVIVDKNASSMNADRPWLPGLVVKWIDEKRGRWMYPSDGPVREHWFWPGRFRDRLGRVFSDARVEHLISPSEACHLLFRVSPRARLLAIWTAKVPGGPRA